MFLTFYVDWVSQSKLDIGLHYSQRVFGKIFFETIPLLGGPAAKYLYYLKDGTSEYQR